jgi:hypothetical protein
MSKFIKRVEPRPDNKRVSWEYQTTPIIGYMDTAYKSGGILIIGDNENIDNEVDPDKRNKKNNTGKERDHMLDTYTYYTIFTKNKGAKGGLKNSLNLRNLTKDGLSNGNVKFAELYPIKTKSVNDIKNLKVPHGEDFDDWCFENNLRIIIEEIKPTLIIANSMTVSKVFVSKTLGKRTSKDEYAEETTIKYELKNGIQVPVILSGKLTGRNGSDIYNRHRIIEQMSHEIAECLNGNSLNE